MPSLREIRRKVKSIRSTEKITRAMKMVATARLARAQGQILAARPFAVKMHDLLVDLSGRLGNLSKDSDKVVLHPLLEERKPKKIAILLITADKGLCGAFNTNLIKKTTEIFQINADKSFDMFLVGKKGREFFRKSGIKSAGEYVGIFNNLSYIHAEIIGRDIIDFYLNENIGEVLLVYNEFKSVIQQNLVVKKLIPIERSNESVKEERFDFIYEPDRNGLLDSLLPRYVKAQIFRALLESNAAEMAARMTAMENASQNALDMIDSLTLKMNKVRQTTITREIAELVGGVEALK